SPYFGNVQVNKEERDCLGIKVCQFTDHLQALNIMRSILNHHCGKELLKIKTSILKKLTPTTYLAAKDTSCKFKYDNRSTCSGKPILCKLRISQDIQNVYQWFIGCSIYRIGDQWHRYIKINSENVDIVLLRDLFLEKEVIQEELPYCTTLLHRSSKRKKCDYIHRLSNRNIDYGEIIQKHCPVKFYKFTLQNLEVCLFIAIVCVGTHNHPPPPPEKIPVDIKLSLQSLISQAIEDNDIITPRSIQSIAKAYKNMHPYGQGILGVFHAAKNSHSEIKDYLHRIGWEYIIGDLDSVQAKGLGLALYNIDPSRDWEINLFNKQFSQEIHDLAKSILNAPSQELVKSILDKIELSDEPGAKEWANYYKTPWIISSLKNVHMSKMERNIWKKHDDNTNSAESAHALANKEGKQLKLLSAILR
ncbi:21803_t:CDS:2, partial [Racocetra persica]